MNTLLSITLLALAPPPQVTANTLNGSTYQGTLAAWNTQGIQLQLGRETDGEIKEIPVDQLLELNWLGRERKTTESQLHVELIDESKIRISTIQITDHVATITLHNSMAEIKIPTQSIQIGRASCRERV